jgi:Short C-terminal domain
MDPAPAKAASPVEELTKLADMLEKGLLTRDEFDLMKARLIGLRQNQWRPRARPMFQLPPRQPRPPRWARMNSVSSETGTKRDRM